MPYIGHSPEVAQRRYESIDDISGSFNGSTTSFALQVGGVTPAPFPVASENVLISVGGVIQEPDGGGTNGFQLTGTNIVFSSAPNSGQSFFGVILAGADYVTAGHAFPDGDAGNPSITFSQDLDSGLFRSGAGTTSVSANNNKIADFGPTEIVFNEDGDNVDFRVEGDTKANLFVVDAGNDKITLDGDLEPTTLNGITFPTDGALSDRNLIDNGAMQVSQRGTSFTGITSSNQFITDRFKLNVEFGTFSGEQSSTTPSGFGNSIKVDCTSSSTSPSAADENFLEHVVEAQDLQHLSYGESSAKSITLSFYVRSNKTGSYGVWIYSQDGNRQYATTYTISAADTFEFKTITIPGDASGTINDDNGGGLFIRWYLGAGSSYAGTPAETWQATGGNRTTSLNLADSTSNEWLITGVQLEVGTKATPFEHKSYQDELAKCRRYYFQSRQLGDTYEGCYYGYGISTNRIGAQVRLPIEMRTDPSFILIRPVDGVQDGAHRYFGVSSGSTGDVSFSSVGFADRGRLGFPYITLNSGSIVQGAGYLFHIEAYADL